MARLRPRAARFATTLSSIVCPDRTHATLACRATTRQSCASLARTPSLAPWARTVVGQASMMASCQQQLACPASPPRTPASLRPICALPTASMRDAHRRHSCAPLALQLRVAPPGCASRSSHAARLPTPRVCSVSTRLTTAMQRPQAAPRRSRARSPAVSVPQAWLVRQAMRIFAPHPCQQVQACSTPVYCATKTSGRATLGRMRVARMSAALSLSQEPAQPPTSRARLTCLPKQHWRHPACASIQRAPVRITRRAAACRRRVQLHTYAQLLHLSLASLPLPQRRCHQLSHSRFRWQTASVQASWRRANRCWPTS